MPCTAYFCGIVLLCCIAATEAWIKFQEVKNEKNVTQFSIIEGQTFEVPNHHRNGNPSFKFSLTDIAIDFVNKPNVSASGSRWSFNINDTHSAMDFTIVEHDADVTEYNFVWHGVGQHRDYEVCVHYQHNSAFWYQGYQSNDSHWPMDVKKRIDKVQFNSMFELERLSAPWYSYWTREFQFILEHLLVNSDGFAVHLDHLQPLFVRRNPNGNDALMCFSVNVDGRYYLPRFHSKTDLDLKFRFFASKNIRTVSDYVVHQSSLVPKPTEIPKNLDLFRNPIWFSGIIPGREFNEDKIETFASNLSSHGVTTKNEFIIEHYHWIDYLDNYTVDSKMFPHMDVLIKNLTPKGVQLGGMLVSPRLAKTTKHPEFDKFVLHDPWKNPLWFIDLSLPEAVKYYSSLLAKLHKDNKLNTFWLKSFIRDFPAVFNDTLVSKFPSLYATKYIEAASKASDATVVSEFAYKTQHLPVFYNLVHYFITSPKQLLQEFVPTALSVSLAGYSFLIHFPIGGFDNRPKPIGTHQITEEQYIRMLQAATFMPSMAFTKVPWDFSQKTVDLAKKFINLHAEHADTIIALARERVKDGTPIIRPMWYSSPDDAKTYQIGDQFMCGNNIIVAPVVVEGQRERNVYLPAGNWIDQHGKSYTGPGQFKVLAPLEELPYFKRSEH